MGYGMRNDDKKGKQREKEEKEEKNVGVILMEVGKTETDIMT